MTTESRETVAGRHSTAPGADPLEGSPERTKDLDRDPHGAMGDDRREASPDRSVASAVAAIADPGPLGLAGFAATTFVLSVFNAHIITDAKLEAVVLPLALFYGGLAQLLAGMWEFKKANTFGALAFTSYGAFWLSFAALVKFVAPGLPAATAHEGIGLYLLVWTIFTAYMTLASARVSGAVLGVFVALTVTFLLLTIGELSETSSITHAGGWAGLVTAVIAWYASAAGVTNSTWRRTVLPVLPLAPKA